MDGVHHEAPEHRAHLPGLADPRAHPRLPARGCALPPPQSPAPAEGSRPGRPPPAAPTRRGPPRVRRQCFQRMAATRLPPQDRSDRGGLGVNVPLIIAGCLAILGTAIHGVGGEVLVVRKLSPGMLPSSPFGGPRMTKAMIHVTWHMTTIAFLTVGSALLLSGSVLNGDTARGLGLGAASASTGFAALAVGLGAYTQSPRSLFRHPGPAVLIATA